MKHIEMRVKWSEDHHKDVLIEVPDEFIDEDIEYSAIETAKAENLLHPHDSCDDSHDYRVEVAEE